MNLSGKHLLYFGIIVLLLNYFTGILRVLPVKGE